MGDSGRIYEVNLSDLVEQYVWRRYKEDMSFLRRLFFSKKFHYIDIRWGYAKFEHTTTRSNVELPETTKETTLDLYSSEYENETTGKQTYTFSTSRQTTATTSIQFQDSYKIGAKTNLEVNLASFGKIGGEVSGEMSVTDTRGEEYSVVQTWNINTNVDVEKKTRAIAVLELKAINRITNFEVKTVVSLPKGNLPVSIRKRTDDRIVKTYWITNLNAIFPSEFLKRAKDIIEIKKVPVPGTGAPDIQVVLTTRGVLKRVMGKEQRVQVKYKPLTSATKEKSSSEDQTTQPSESGTHGESSRENGDVKPE